MMSRTRFSGLSWFIIIGLVGLSLRSLWVTQVHFPPVSDFETYYKLAISIRNGSGYSLGVPVAYQGCGYPFALAGFFWLAGTETVLTAKLFNVLLWAVSTIPVAYILNKVLEGRRQLALLGFVVFALLPKYVIYCGITGTEVLTVCLLATLVALQISPLRGTGSFVLLGLLAGALALVRPVFIAYPAAMVVYEWLSRDGAERRHVFRYGAIVCATMLISLMPWAYRNYRVFHTFTPVSSNGGAVLFINNNDRNTTGYCMDISEVPPSASLLRALAAKGRQFPYYGPDVESIYRNEAMRWVWNHKSEFAKIGFKRVANVFMNGNDLEDAVWFGIGGWESLARLFTHPEDAASPIRAVRTVNLIYVADNTAVIWMSFMGFCCVVTTLACLVRRRQPPSMGNAGLVTAVNLCYFGAVHFATEGQPRYVFPVLLFYIIGSMVTLDTLSARGRPESSSLSPISDRPSGV